MSIDQSTLDFNQCLTFTEIWYTFQSQQNFSLGSTKLFTQLLGDFEMIVNVKTILIINRGAICIEDLFHQ